MASALIEGKPKICSRALRRVDMTKANQSIPQMNITRHVLINYMKSGLQRSLYVPHKT